MENETEDFIISEKGEIYSKKERDFKGIWIPKEIYLHKNLSWMEKSLYIEIDSLCKQNGCFAGNNYFSRFLKVREDTISKSISKLKRLGLVEQLRFDGRNRILSTNIQGRKKILGRLGKKSYADLGKNPSLYINTISNNTFNNKSICVSGETRKNNSGKTFKEAQTEKILKKLKASAFTQKVLKVWNCLPNITPHEKPSKTWLEIIKGINMLRKGSLYKKKFDKQFLKRNKIPESLLRYKFSKQEIMTTLKKVSQWCEQGYLIQSSGFKTTLSNAIYNPFGNIQSVFLIACVRDPEPRIKELQNKYPEITVYFEKESGIKLKDKELNQVLQNLNRLKVYYQENIQGKQMGYSLSNKVGNFSQMCISFVDWLKENHINKNLTKDFKYNSTFMFNPNSFLFEKFIKWINQQHNCSFKIKT